MANICTAAEHRAGPQSEVPSFDSSPPCLWRQGLSQKLEVTDWLGQLTHELQKSTCIHLPSPLIQH